MRCLAGEAQETTVQATPGLNPPLGIQISRRHQLARAYRSRKPVAARACVAARNLPPLP